MAFLEIGLEGALNGTTNVDVVTVPSGAARRLVRNVHFCNRDTATRTIILSKNMNGTIYELARETLLPNEYWTFDKLIILDATTEKLVAKTDATAATTEPSFDSAFADAT